ncbi:hypothetical protein HYS48_02740, partial [Candidatus Woesearchaeota archaeon]|nr:hypothetical protein [Candidatus Woesearchaeota archaeon]
KELEEKSQKAEQALKEKQEDLKQRKQEINDLRKEIERINKEIETKGEKEQVAMHKEVEQLRVSLATAQNRIQHCQEEIKKVQERRKQLEQNVGDVKEKLERIEKERVGIQESIQDANKQIQQLEKSIQDFRKKHKMEDIGDIDKQVDALDKDGEEKQKEIQTLRAKQQELLREKDKLELHIASVDDKIEKVLAVEEEHKEQVQDLKQKKQAFKEASNELNQLLNKDSELAAQLGNARQSRLTMQEDLSRLQARNISIQEQAAGDEAVKRILQQKNKIPGIFGTVAELGNVSSKYALALDVAAAQKIKSMVVKDDTTAEQCINYLKQNKLGVATFLPLNKIKPVHKHPEIEALAKEKGVHGFALDLIEYDPKFQNVFSYVFGNTLVVEDITAARNIGIGRARMATLDGDLTEISGAMHGGFRKKATMGVGFAEKELGDTIVALEKKIKDTEQLIMRLEKDRVKAEESITTLRQEKAHLEGEVIKMEKSLYLDAGDIDVSKKQKQEYQEGLKKVEKELDKMQDAIEKVNKGLAENKTKKQELRERITALRSPTIVAELQAFEEKKRELRESIIHHEAELRNLEGQKKTILGPEQENLLKVIKQTEKEEQAFAEEVKLLKQKIVQGEASLKEQEKAEKKFYEQFKDLFNQRTKMDEQIKKTEEKMEILNEQEKKLDHQLNALTLELAQAKAFVAGLEKQFEEYKEVPLVQNKSEGQLRKDIGIFEGVITRMGNINMKALEIYERVEKEYSELLKKKDKLGLEKEDVLLMMNEIETKKKELFMRTFDVVNTNFKTIFSALSTKGEAFLDLENPDNPFAGGLLVKVRLTGTKFMDIRSLSGGEKTLTALAFIFSIQEHEPASFYVLDEV